MPKSTRTQELNELRDVLKRLLGKVVTRIVAGGSAGSILGIHFNEVANNAAWAAEGEWYLGVECSWRVDTSEGPLASSSDDNAPNGPMLLGLQSLRGLVVSAIEVAEPALDLVIRFTQGSKLTIFCDVLRGRTCWYLMGPDGIERSVEW